MFTGLIETTGDLKEISRLHHGLTLGIAPRRADFHTAAGASVSVSGACLTVERIGGGVVFFTAVAETLARTTLNQARVGDTVNLERALPVSGRLEGHFVLGHVDGVGQIMFQRREGESMVCGIRVPDATRRYMVEKGSVAIDGISLTIAGYRDDLIEIAFIPFTLEHTTMSGKRVGDFVNVESDVLARYIAGGVEAPIGKPAASDGSDAGGATILDLLERSGF